MNLTITLESPTPSELAIASELLARLAAEGARPPALAPTATAPEDVAAPAAPERPAAGKKKVEKAAPAPAAAAPAAPPTPIQPPAPAVTMDQLKEEMRKLAEATGGIAAVKEVLAEVGAPRLPDLPPEKYPAMLDAIRRRLAAGKRPPAAATGS
ncbi:MAG TPA: hypothetical protein VNM34_14965 [Verrucomicrobiae bacterium]|nr:hypothetical protein [Verrucomicrobiae bacterium]